MKKLIIPLILYSLTSNAVITNFNSRSGMYKGACAELVDEEFLIQLNLCSFSFNPEDYSKPLNKNYSEQKEVAVRILLDKYLENNLGQLEFFTTDGNYLILPLGQPEMKGRYPYVSFSYNTVIPKAIKDAFAKELVTHIYFRVADYSFHLPLDKNYLQQTRLIMELN